MSFAGTNLLAVLVAAIAAWLWGAVFYGALGRRWIRAARLDPAAVKMRAEPFIISFVAELIMAFVLAGAIGHLGPGEVTLVNGLISGLILWAGFVATVIAVNHRYQGFGWDLTIIDSIHWLGVLLIAGAIIGWWGA